MLSDHLVEHVEGNATGLKDRWMEKASEHPAIPSFRQIDTSELERHIEEMYRKLGIYMDKTHEAQDLAEFFMQYGEERKKQSIPIYELLYMIVLARHNLWEFIMEWRPVQSTLEWQQLSEFWRRVMRFFDEYAYFVLMGYEEGSELTDRAEDIITKYLSALSLGSLPELEEEKVQ